MSFNNRENKVILITNIPNPYRIPLFNELNRQLNDKGVKLKVIFGVLGYPRRKWHVDMSRCQFQYMVLPSRRIPNSDPEKVSFTYSNLYKMISKENPSVIITNAFSIATMKLWLRSFFKNTPYIIWSGAIQRKNRPDSYLRILQRKVLIKRAAGYIAYGKKAKEYLIYLGADQNKIEIGINTVDTKFFMLESEKLRKLKHNDNNKHLLYIGHLTKGKRIDQLFEVIKILSKFRNDFFLELVGDGDEMENLKKLSNNLNISDIVKFEGFRQKQDIPQYLARADCFLFPSEYDVWGLVLIESMAAGLPCISSIYAGATYDLIQDEVTGFAVDFSEKEKVAEKIDWVIENPELAKEIGQNASQFIAENASIEKSATGFLNAVKKILD